MPIRLSLTIALSILSAAFSPADCRAAGPNPAYTLTPEPYSTDTPTVTATATATPAPEPTVEPTQVPSPAATIGVCPDLRIKGKLPRRAVRGLTAVIRGAVSDPAPISAVMFSISPPGTAKTARLTRARFTFRVKGLKKTPKTVSVWLLDALGNRCPRGVVIQVRRSCPRKKCK